MWLRFENSLNNHCTLGYHLDLSMDVSRAGVIAPLIGEVFIAICLY